jgi:hypothetical protein
MRHPNWRETDRYANQTDPEILYADLQMRAGQWYDARANFERLLVQSEGDRAELLTLKLEELTARQAIERGDNVTADSLIRDVLRKYDPGHEHRGEFLELWNLMERPPSRASQPAK